MMREVLCPYCGQLLFVANDTGPQIEIRCQHCARILVWPGWNADLRRNDGGDEKPPRRIGPTEYK